MCKILSCLLQNKLQQILMIPIFQDSLQIRMCVNLS